VGKNSIILKTAKIKEVIMQLKALKILKEFGKPRIQKDV